MAVSNLLWAGESVRSKVMILHGFRAIKYDKDMSHLPHASIIIITIYKELKNIYSSREEVARGSEKYSSKIGREIMFSSSHKIVWYQVFSLTHK